MAETLGVPLPDPQYLTKVGRAMYAATSFLSGPLGDLQCIPNLPEQYCASYLQRETLGGLARCFGEAANDQAISPADRTCFRSWSQAMYAVVTMRNDLIHSLAATANDGKSQMLVRYRPNGANAAWIDDDWFEEFDQLLIDQWKNLPDSDRPFTRYRQEPRRAKRGAALPVSSG